MPYRLPTFNLLANVWFCNTAPNDAPPDVADVPCQKYVVSRPTSDVTPPFVADWWQNWSPPIVLRFELTGPYAGTQRNWQGGCFEVPSGSFQFYRCYFQEIMHEGFPNQYAAVFVTQCDGDGKSMPPPGRGIATGTGSFPSC